MKRFVFASDSVLAGHPDKICDRISDALVDAALAQDRPAGVNAECAVASGVIFIALRHAGPAPADPAALARRVLADSGYPDSALSAQRTTVLVDAVRDDALPGPGAGPLQAGGGMATLFGYACAATPERMPAPLATAHAVVRALDDARRGGELAWLSPDGQVQAAVTFEDRRPVALAGLSLRLGVSGRPMDDAAATVRVRASDAARLLWPDADAIPTALDIIDSARGPQSHAGLTGRKTADDLYGGYARQSASGLSGKDPSRIERSAAYAARHAALSVIAAGLARECEIQLCYSAGGAGPISVVLDSFDSGVEPDAALTERVRRAFDFRGPAIAERLGLWSLPAARSGRFYADLAAYGQVGRSDLSPPWEMPDPSALA